MKIERGSGREYLKCGWMPGGGCLEAVDIERERDYLKCEWNGWLVDF
jgi:hypothetical protein